MATGDTHHRSELEYLAFDLEIRLATVSGTSRGVPELFYSGQMNGITNEARMPIDRFSGTPTLRKSVNLYPPGP